MSTYDAAVPASAGRERDYADLKRRISAAGLLAKQPLYYAWKFPATLALIGAALAVPFLTSSLWLQLLGAVLLAFAIGQGGLLMHDTCHRQPNSPGCLNDALCLLTGPLLIGVSSEWWTSKHNRHHSHPNQIGHDPDINIGLAFTRDQAREATGFVRWVMRYQAYLFFPLLLFEAFHLKLASAKFLILNRSKNRALEATLVGAHNAGLVLFAVLGLGAWRGALYLLVAHGMIGLYLGSIFAPNHKGMEVLDEESELDFFCRQVITSRNVRGSLVRDMWYGGLNYQIEHHLFPGMPRNRLRRAKPLIEAFCRERGVPYHETGMLRSFRELLNGLYEAGAPLRKPASALHAAEQETS
jgi:fatty acid desaturase